MMDFVSKLEELMPAVELNFEPTQGFGRFNRYLKHAVAHPAKMNTNLLEFLIKAYTKPGDTILDPMCGSGSTGVVAALHGRNAVQIDIEQKFIDWAEEAKRKVESSTKTEKGQILNICGDARKLSAILKEADVALTSPPYSNLQQTGDSEETLKLWEERFGRSFGKGWKAKKYSEKPENIGNLPMGEINTILTSPPYAETKKGVANAEDWADRMEKFGSTEESRRERHTPGRLRAAKAMSEGYSQNKDNIGNLPFVDTILTSPPYSDVAKSKEGAISPHMQGLISKLSGIPVKDFAHNVEKLKEAVKIAQSKIPFRYSESKDNIGTLPMGNIDTIITSPPYGEAQEGSGIAKRGYQGSKHSPTDLVGKRSYMPDKFESPDNISNLPMGCIDTILTSPPYVNQEVGKGFRKNRWEKIKDRESFKGRKEWMTGTPSHYSENPENIGNLPLGKEVDVVLTSPPYSEGIGHDSGDNASEQFKERLEMQRRYTRQMVSKGNIANLPLGKIDTIITSPPFGDSYTGGGDSEKRKERLIKAGYDPKDFLGGKARNAVLKHYTEVDTVITSPPYERQHQGGRDSPKVRHGCIKERYQNTENIGNLPLGDLPRDQIDNTKEYGMVDVIVTSPPYEGSLEGTSRHTRGGIASRDPALAQTGTYATRLSFGVPVGYSPNKENIGNLKSSSEEYAELDETIKRLREYGRTDPKAGGPYGRSLAHSYSPNKDNIGNLKSTDEEYQNITSGLLRKDNKPTYLSEMFKVYSEMWKVLKPGGLAIVVVKPFIRQKKPVDLPYHTYLIMRRCGFVLEKLFKLRLKTESFWRVNYRYRCNHMGGKVGEQVKCKVHGFCPYESKEKRIGCADYLPMSEIVATIAHEYVLVCQKPHPEMAVQHQPNIDHDEYALLSKLEEAQFRLAKKLAKKIKGG